MSNFSIGIDLGTTFSTVAFLDSNGKPEIIRNENGELITDSVVFFDSLSAMVGREAVREAEFDPTRIAKYVKRTMGDRFYPNSIVGKELPPECIQAIILRKLKSDAELTLGPIQEAVISVPACFGELRRKSTQEAAALAGINVMDIVNEPMAAAIAYGVHSGFLNESAESSQKELVLVYDLGGGTFDATIMEIDGFRFDAIATVGDIHLGGVDWDQRLVDHIAVKLEKEKNLDCRANAAFMERLNQEAVSLKKTLSTRKEAKSWLGSPGNSTQFKIRRHEFERMTADLVERTRMGCQRLLNDAALSWKDLTRLILVGGATRMPMVQAMLEKESGLEVDRTLSPEEAVAQGAAIYAGVLRSAQESRHAFSISNINSHDLGVLGLDEKTKLQKRQIMVPKNSRLPATSSKRFLTAKDGQKTVAVTLVEGGTEQGDFATRIGECVVTDLPDNLPRGTCVEVTFQYAKDGRLSVSALLPDFDSTANIRIDRVSDLESREFEFWKNKILDFKIDSLILPGESQLSEVPGEALETEMELELDALFQEMENGQIFHAIQEKSTPEIQVEIEKVDETQNQGRIEEDQELQKFLKDLK